MQVGDKVRSKHTGLTGYIIERFGGYAVEGEHEGTRWSSPVYGYLPELHRGWTLVKTD